MSTKIELLKFLDENYGSFVSGECLAQTLGVSRAAVNKAASALKKSGYKILSRPSQGYKLLEKIDILTEESIGSKINEACKLWFLMRLTQQTTLHIPCHHQMYHR